MYKFLYYLFLFCTCVLSTQKLGISLTPRQLFAVIMFVVCFMEEKKLWCDKLFGVYLAFVFCYGISSMLTGYVSDFLLRLIGDYFVAYVGVWAVTLLITKYKSIDFFIYAFISIGIFDGIVTIFQFLGITFLDSFLNRFNLIGYDPYLTNYQGSGEALLSRCVPGIFSHPVLNAHALAATTVLSTFIACKKKILGTGISLLMLTSLFCTQQRTAFAIGLVCVATIIIIASIKTKYRIVVAPSLLFIILYLGFYLYNFILNGDFRFSELGLDSTGRDIVYKYCVTFIKNNPLQVSLFPIKLRHLIFLLEQSAISL